MVNLQSSLKVSCRYLIPVTQGEPEFNADALYAFKSRGFGGEIGVVIGNSSLVTSQGSAETAFHIHSVF